jgi:hypothetical protein
MFKNTFRDVQRSRAVRELRADESVVVVVSKSGDIKLTAPVRDVVYLVRLLFIVFYVSARTKRRAYLQRAEGAAESPD